MSNDTYKKNSDIGVLEEEIGKIIHSPEKLKEIRPSPRIFSEVFDQFYNFIEGFGVKNKFWKSADRYFSHNGKNMLVLSYQKNILQDRLVVGTSEHIYDFVRMRGNLAGTRDNYALKEMLKLEPAGLIIFDVLPLYNMIPTAEYEYGLLKETE